MEAWWTLCIVHIQRGRMQGTGLTEMPMTSTTFYGCDYQSPHRWTGLEKAVFLCTKEESGKSLLIHNTVRATVNTYLIHSAPVTYLCISATRAAQVKISTVLHNVSI